MHAEALDSGLFGGSQPAELLWSGASPSQQPHTAVAAQRDIARVPGDKGRMADGTASQAARPADAGMAVTLRTGSAASLGATPAIVGRRGSGGEVSGSLVRSVFDAVRSGFSAVGRALLPPSLHQLLDGGPALERMWWRPAASAAAAWVGHRHLLCTAFPYHAVRGRIMPVESYIIAYCYRWERGWQRGLGVVPGQCSGVRAAGGRCASTGPANGTLADARD